MRPAPILGLLASLSVLGCPTPPSAGPNGHPIVHQGKIADIACGPSAMFNWMSHGGDGLQAALVALSAGRTPVETVREIIDTYGTRPSVTKPSVVRYGRHNGGVGSLNLLVMARELLGDHLRSPPDLQGEYLHRRQGESDGEHLERIRGWFGDSIDSGIPVMLYLRAYERSSDGRLPRMVFGHHVVVTSFDATADSSHRRRGVGFTFVDSGSGRVDHGELLVAERDFTAPTFTYRLDGDRALTTESLRTGRPLLEVRIPSYEPANPPSRVIVVAHFATFSGSRPAADGPSWRLHRKVHETGFGVLRSDHLGVGSSSRLPESKCRLYRTPDRGRRGWSPPPRGRRPARRARYSTRRRRASRRTRETA